MRFGICLLVPLLLTSQAHSIAGSDSGSGDDQGPGISRGSITITQKPEGSGAGGLPDDEDSRPLSAAVTTTTTAGATSAAAGATSAAAATIAVTSSTSRSVSQGGDQEQGSGAGGARLACDSPRECFCVDENNREIPNTRGRISCTPIDEEPIVPKVAVPYGSNVSPSSASPVVTSAAVSPLAEEVDEIDIDAISSSPATQASSSSAAAVTTQTTTVATSTPSTTTRTTPTTTASPTTAAPTSTRAPAIKTLAAVRQPAPSTVKAMHVASIVTTTLSNVIPVDPTVPPAGPADDDNSIGAAVPLSGSPGNEGDGLLHSLHPGLLAAIIGGAVVGLLCAILLIMFIVYRMRKKDEGSYPLDDGKPRMAYAAKSSANKEFYA